MVGTGNGSPTLPSRARQACQGSGRSGTVHIGRFFRLGARSSHRARSRVSKQATVSFWAPISIDLSGGRIRDRAEPCVPRLPLEGMVFAYGTLSGCVVSITLSVVALTRNHG